MVEIDFKYYLRGIKIDIIWATIWNFIFGLTASQVIPIWGKALDRPFWFSPENLLMDVLWITFYTALLGSFFTTLTVRDELEKGKAKIPPWNRKSIPLLKHIPKSAFFRAVTFAIFAVLLYVPIAGGTLLLLGVESAPYWSFIALKIIYGIMVSTTLGIVVRTCALGDGFSFRK